MLGILEVGGGSYWLVKITILHITINMAEPVSHPIVRFSSNSAIIYNHYLTPLRKTEKQVDAQKFLTRKVSKGTMSHNTASRVKKMLTGWIEAVQVAKKRKVELVEGKKPYITFVTLTLSAPQRHFDQTVKRKLLGQFLKEIQEKEGVRNYFWRTEPQANGNIHIHILCDSFIPWRSIRARWNRIQEKLGYVSRYQEKHQGMTFDRYQRLYGQGGKVPTEKLRKAYAYGVSTNWLDPNSTDIHRLEKVEDASAYVVKYVCKGKGERRIQGRVWGCSDAVRKGQVYEEFLGWQEHEIIEAAKKTGKPEVEKKEEYTIIRFPFREFIQANYPAYWEKIEEFYINVGRDIYHSPEPIPQEHEKPPPSIKENRYIQLEVF